MGLCEQCGGELRTATGGRPQTRYCSRNCKDAAASAAKSAQTAAARIGRACAQCSGPIPESVNLRAKTCSRECGIAYQNRRRAEGKRAAWLASKAPCGHCGEEIPESRAAGSLYCSPECKRNAIAARWRKRSPGYMRQYLYGLTPEQYDAMLQAQGGRCAICRSENWPGKANQPHVDHDHVTGKVRALLCTNCNNGLGSFGDDPARLRAAADYLEAHGA